MNLHKIANLRDKQLARIRIKNKLYGGRVRCANFRLSTGTLGVMHGFTWHEPMIQPFALGRRIAKDRF